MLRHIVAVVVIAVLIGCGGPSRRQTATSNSLQDTDARAAGGGSSADGVPPMGPTQLAAYAGDAKFPSNLPPRNDLPAAAIVSRDGGAIKVYNFSNQSLRDINLWVNGAFVRRVSGVAPQTSVAVSTSELYDAFGYTFASKSEEVSRVQLHLPARDALYTLWGPAAE